MSLTFLNSPADLPARQRAFQQPVAHCRFPELILPITACAVSETSTFSIGGPQCLTRAPRAGEPCRVRDNRGPERRARRQAPLHPSWTRGRSTGTCSPARSLRSFRAAAPRSPVSTASASEFPAHAFRGTCLGALAAEALIIVNSSSRRAPQLTKSGHRDQVSFRGLVRITRTRGIRYVLINPADPAAIIDAFRQYRASHWSEPPILSKQPLPDFLRRR